MMSQSPSRPHKSRSPCASPQRLTRRFSSREENKFFFYDNFYGDGKWNVNQIYFLFRSWTRDAMIVHGRSQLSARKVDEELLEITLYDVRRISFTSNQKKKAERKKIQLQLDNPIRPSSGTCVSGTNQATTFAAYLIETKKICLFNIWGLERKSWGANVIRTRAQRRNRRRKNLLDL